MCGYCGRRLQQLVPGRGWQCPRCGPILDRLGAGLPLAWGLIDRADLTDLDWLTWLVDHETARRYVTPVLALAPPDLIPFHYLLHNQTA